MFRRTASLALMSFLLLAINLIPAAAAQEQTAKPSAAEAQTAVGAESLPAKVQPVVVPVGTRLPLLLRNGINTRTAKAGDSVYFETLYPIAQDGRIVIPVGSFVRGEVVSVKRPGRIKGRGEIRLQLESLTFPNGYVAALNATPNSVDRDGKEGVDSEGTIKGRSSVGKDVGIVALGTVGGFYLGSQAGIVSPIARDSRGAVGGGAAIGTGVGALAGFLVVLLTRGPEAELPRGTTLDFVFDRPFALDADRLPAPGQIVERDPLQLLPVREEQGPADNSKKEHRRRLFPRVLPDL
jgi:hypothetical protein